MNSIVSIILSLVPFILVGGWLVYREVKSKSTPKRIRVGDKDYVVKKKSRILALEKTTGKTVIVTTCGVEGEQQKLEGELKSLPGGVKVRYRLKNGIFPPEESDWLAGENFKFLGVSQVEEYEQA